MRLWFLPTLRFAACIHNVKFQLEVNENRDRNFVLENPCLTSRSWQTMVCHLYLYKLLAKNGFYFLNGWKRMKKKNILWLRKIVWNSDFDIYELSLSGTREGQLSSCSSRVEYLWQRQYVVCPGCLLSGPFKGEVAALCTRGSLKAVAPHSSTLAWRIPGTAEPGRLQSMGSRRVDTTERLHFHFSPSCIGEGSGNPLQCSCQENPRDGGACWVTVYGLAQSQTRLQWLSGGSSSTGGSVNLGWVDELGILCVPWNHM